MYCEALVGPHKKTLNQSHMLGFVYGLSQALLFVSYGTVLYYGAILIRDENLDYKVIFVIGEALVWTMLMLGNTLAFAPNYNKAKVAGGRILQLLNRKPVIVNSPGVGLQIKNCQGSVIFDKTEFHYPTRPQVKILKGLNLGIEPTLNIGVCGPSGSGKSTCIQLILRYYDPTLGRVLLDETDVGALNVVALRSQMAIVSQEPALFDRTMADNIAYGDNSRSVEMSEIIEAARSANIHDFIASLPAGYSTRVGDMGAQLSGGQKQRVAIARALIRNPKLLLLDEATSALDTGSEKIVQAALDNASAGRTCITIAHRLSSIQNADRILVINGGRLSESGTHTELLQKHGIYYKLWNMQRHGVS
jgi:ABC-type multidrug transport system fused ATPase/permease subunit